MNLTYSSDREQNLLMMRGKQSRFVTEKILNTRIDVNI